MTAASCRRKQHRRRARRRNAKARIARRADVRAIARNGLPRRLVMVPVSCLSTCACCGDEQGPTYLLEEPDTRVGLAACAAHRDAARQAMFDYELAVEKCATLRRTIGKTDGWRAGLLQFYRRRVDAVQQATLRPEGRLIWREQHLFIACEFWPHGHVAEAEDDEPEEKLARLVRVANIACHTPELFTADKSAGLHLKYDAGRNGVWHSRWRTAVAEGLRARELGVGASFAQ
jgi:hypothetical protein